MSDPDLQAQLRRQISAEAESAVRWATFSIVMAVISLAFALWAVWSAP